MLYFVDVQKSVLQGVDDAAKSTKQAVENLQSSSSGTQSTVNQQASNVREGIDSGADTAKDALEGAPQARADAKRTVSSQANALQENVDQGADALKDAIGGTPSSRQGARQIPPPYSFRMSTASNFHYLFSCHLGTLTLGQALRQAPL